MLHRLDVQRPVLFAKFCTEKRLGEPLDIERVEKRVEWVAGMVQRFAMWYGLSTTACRAVGLAKAGGRVRENAVTLAS
jgi:hypothetical protein